MFNPNKLITFLKRINIKNNKSLTVIFALVFSTIGVSSALILVRLSELDASATLMLRMFCAGGLIFLFSNPYSKIENTSLNSQKPNILLILSGLVSCIDLLSNHWAVKFTTVANTTLLMSLSPVFVVLLSFIIWNERISIKKLLALAIAVIGGIILISGDKNLHFSALGLGGDLLALNSALFYGIYLLIIKKLRNQYSSKLIMLWNSFTSAIILLPFVIYTSPIILPKTIMGYSIIILLAIISQLIGHGLMAYALRHISAVTASISTLARPIVASILAWIVLGQKIYTFQLIGAILVLSGIYFYNNIQVTNFKLKSSKK